MNTQEKGQVAQLKVELRTLEKGFIASRPVIDSRYDLVIDDGIKLWKVQIKYVDSKPKTSEVVNVDLRKYPGNDTRKRRVYTKKEIDAVIAYIPKIDILCWLPPELFDGKVGVYLRIGPAKNSQKKGVHFAHDLIW